MSLDLLSRRQRQVAELMLTGLSGREIADRLGVVVKTVRWHTTEIYARLELKTRSQFLAKYLSPHRAVEGGSLVPKPDSTVS